MPGLAAPAPSSPALGTNGKSSARHICCTPGGGSPTLTANGDRTVKTLVVFAAIIALTISACTQPTGSSDDGPIAGACVTDKTCGYGYECSNGGCVPLAPSIYPHIQLASQLLRAYIDDGEIAWRATHYDLLIGNVRPDDVRPLNPNARLFDYVVTRYHVPQEVAAAEAWAAANGHDPEVLFLHYREDVVIPGRESQVIVPGFPPGVVPGWNPAGGGGTASATERSQSRAISNYLGTSQPWYFVNTDNPVGRRYLVEKCAQRIDGTFYGQAFATGPVEGVMCDEAIYYATFGDGVLDRTDEYFGVPMSDEHPYPVSVETSYAAIVQGLYNEFGVSKDVLPNYGHTLFLFYNNRSAINVQSITPWIWPQVWVTETGASSPTGGTNRCITYERDYQNAVAGIVSQTRAGGRRVLGARDISGGLSGSDRARMFTLGLYYLVHNLNTYYMYETTGPFNGHLSTWNWNPTVEYDVGVPAPVPAGVQDFAGRSGTSEHWLFASGADPHVPALTYRVFARRFTNALVLVKMLPEGSVIDDRSITTHTLDGTYAVLQPNGSAGAVVTEARIRNNEALILLPLD